MATKTAIQNLRLNAELHRSMKSVASALGIKLEQAADEAAALWLAANKFKALKAPKGSR